MKEFEGKFIYLRTIVGRIYSGKVLKVDFMGYGTSNEAIYMITLRDKYGDLVAVNNSMISYMEEEKEDFKKGDEKDGNKPR